MEPKSTMSHIRETHTYPHGDWQILPMMPLRGMVVYPSVLTQLDVGRDRSINAIEQAMEAEDNLIFLTMQKDAQTDEPEVEDVYEIGTVAHIRQTLKLPGGTVRLLVEGAYRAKLVRAVQGRPFILSEVYPLHDDTGDNPKALTAYVRVLRESFGEYAKAAKNIAPDVAMSIATTEDASLLADIVAGHLPAPAEDRQELLEMLHVPARMEKIIQLLDRETEIIELEQSISQKVRQQLDKAQKEYYLREQIRTIQGELGEGNERQNEIDQYRAKIAALDLPEHVLERLDSELGRLEKMPPQVAEAMVITNYIDTVLALPWKHGSAENLNLAKAEKILDQEHYGLEKPKERILEYLAACQLKQNLKGPILCLVGPPGVGKTSLARSIAHATGREFVRMSLGGVRDEAEIRGHRRTYIGAMPGRILANMKQAGTNNPLFLLDEVDKLASDWRGDPTSALLEALDPEQNSTFSDHYLEIPYDLSKVMFVTTANYRSNIPRPLQDRMEIIEVSSYTEEEKLAIAKRHLLPKQISEHGLTPAQLKVSAPALRSVIRLYTREAGVRELERRIAKICRRAGRDLVMGEAPPFKISDKNLEHYLGVPRYLDEQFKKKARLGIATGLAWTEVGGTMLQIEVQTMPGKGKFQITGQLGDVMKESVQAAYTYLRSRGMDYGVSADLEEKLDIHVHVPEGAVPKDGPSAGVTIATALASQFSGRRVRGDVAMTGEITLHGEILPVGGIKEKVLAAWRNQISEVILPKACAKDLSELPPDIRQKMTFHFIEDAEEAFAIALESDSIYAQS